MQIKTSFSTNVIPDQYGCNVSKKQLNHGINQLSFPFTVVDIPQTANYLSWSLIDYDTIPFLGFAWIHWLVADNPTNQTNFIIDSNFSQSTSIPQGRNSLDSLVQRIRRPFWKKTNFFSDLVNHYSGPRPKSGRHTYRLTVYATSEPLKLATGFGLNDIMDNIDPVLIEQVSLNFSYKRGNESC